MQLSKMKRCIVIVGIIIAITSSMLILITIPKEKELLPDRYANFDYSFSYPEIAEEIDKSEELKAWIAYDEGFLNQPFVLYIDEIKREWLPSQSEVQNFLKNNHIVERIIFERSEAWISYEMARSLMAQYYGHPDDGSIGGIRGHCGQYKYIETHALFIPRPNGEIVSVPIVLPNPKPSCFPDRLLEEAYGPLLDAPSIEQRPTFDPADMIKKLYNFLYSHLLILGLSPIVLLGALIWRGSISRIWLTNGFSYSHFELMVKMRGSKTRLDILFALDVPKTRQMIAQELNIDWKAVDRHVKVLLKNDLIKEVYSIARTSYYVRSDKGDKLLDLLNNEYPPNNNVKGYGMSSIVLLFRKR